MASWTSKVSIGFVRNLTLILILFATVAMAAVAEGYAKHLSFLFVGLLVGGFGLSMWLSVRTATARLLALVALAFLMEYVIQTIGVVAGLCQYHGVRGQYIFGVMAWVVGACSAQALSTGVTIPLLQRLNLRGPAWLNSILVLVLVALIPLTAGRYASMMGMSFWCFFGLVGLVAMIAAQRMPIHLFLGVVLSGWLVGNPSEYVGAIASGCWSFPFDSTYPPLYAVLACWPLEILVQFSVSAFLAGEPLSDQTSLPSSVGP